MSRIPTVRVELLASGDVYIINTDDFDPLLHKRIEKDPLDLTKDTTTTSGNTSGIAVDQSINPNLNENTGPLVTKGTMFMKSLSEGLEFLKANKTNLPLITALLADEMENPDGPRDVFVNLMKAFLAQKV